MRSLPTELPGGTEVVDGVHYVYIRCMDYQGNGLKRIYNICEFAWKLPGVCRKFPASRCHCGHLLCPHVRAAMGIHLARKYGCRGRGPEIAESLAGVHCGLWDRRTPENPAVLALRRLEQWIYEKADDVVFTCEGGYDYIVEQGWEGRIPRAKIHYINNGVDLAVFDENRAALYGAGPDLEDPSVFKVVYTGSIRKVNHLVC
ncbi:MAG: glycosyltransferase [Dysosmobacter welbionis]